MPLSQVSDYTHVTKPSQLLSHPTQERSADILESQLTASRRPPGLHFQICPPRSPLSGLLAKTWKLHGLNVNPGKATGDDVTPLPPFTKGPLRPSEAVWLSWHQSPGLLPQQCLLDTRSHFTLSQCLEPTESSSLPAKPLQFSPFLSFFKFTDFTLLFFC